MGVPYRRKGAQRPIVPKAGRHVQHEGISSRELAGRRGGGRTETENGSAATLRQRRAAEERLPKPRADSASRTTVTAGEYRREREQRSRTSSDHLPGAARAGAVRCSVNEDQGAQPTPLRADVAAIAATSSLLEGSGLVRALARLEAGWGWLRRCSRPLLVQPIPPPDAAREMPRRAR